MKIELAKTEIIHFVGIGGIGMSGLALIMKRMGFNVQGSDVQTNKNVERLKRDKIKINIKHSKKNISSATIVVVSSAIKKNNPELIEAKRRMLPIYKRGQMLANIVSLTKNIVVTGSHGKTTTTSLLAAIFSKTKLDPTIINGGVLNAIKNSAKLGKSDCCHFTYSAFQCFIIFRSITQSLINRYLSDFRNFMYILVFELFH